MIKKREVVANLVSRMYKHNLENTGRLPSGKEVRQMEKKAVQTAQRVDRDRK